MTDEARFRALYEAHVGSLVRYALRCSGSLDDVVAETFLVAWRRLNDVPDEPAARLWLYGVARRVLANLGRGAARRERLGVRLAGELRTTAGTQFESVVHDGATLKAALARVDPKDRELLTLTSWEGLTPADIATITGIRVGTVRTRLAASPQPTAERARGDRVEPGRVGPGRACGWRRALARRGKRGAVLTDNELDELIKTLDPVQDDKAVPITRTAQRSALLDAIIAGVSAVDPLVDIGHDRRLPRRWIAMSAAAAAVIAVVIVGVVQIGRNGSDSAWAAPLVEFAESSPLLLMDEPGWVVSRADEHGDEGEMTFTKDHREADLHWRTGSYEEWTEDRADSAVMTTSVTVLGQRAQVTQYPGGDRTQGNFAALWPEGARTLEFRVAAADLAEFERLLGSLVRVDVDTWLSAMPDSVIGPDGRAAAVQEMLADIPLPPGFDPTSLESGELKDRYQLGAEVTGAVACAWVEQWATGKERGDNAAVDEAVAAMATSHDWAILKEMEAEGAWPDSVRLVADSMAGDGLIDGMIPVEDSSLIGCTGR